MNKRIRNIIILAVVLAVVLIADVWISMAEVDPADTAAQVNQTIYISNYSVGSVQRIEIENSSGHLVLLCPEGIWYAQGQEMIELDQELVGELAYMLTHIAGRRQVCDGKDTGNLYGILTPAAKITTHHNGVLKQTFIIGDKAPVEGEYYFQSSVFDKVYTIDEAYYSYGMIEIQDLMVMNRVSITHGDMEKINVRNARGEEYTLQRTADDNDISLCYWEFTQPFNHDADTAVMYGTDEYDGMITYISMISGESVAGSKGSDDAAYGMDKPIFIGTIYGRGNQLQSFVIGDYGDKNNYSLAFNNDDNIYLISKDRAPFTDYSAYMIADANLNLINIDSVDKITIDMPRLKSNMYIAREQVKNADGTYARDEAGDFVYTARIFVDNWDENYAETADARQQATAFYQDLVTVKIDDLILSYKNTREKIGSIEFRLNSHLRDTYTINFYEYSQTHYMAAKNGEAAGYMVSKKEIEKLVKAFKLLTTGQTAQGQ